MSERRSVTITRPYFVEMEPDFSGGSFLFRVVGEGPNGGKYEIEIAFSIHFVTYFAQGLYKVLDVREKYSAFLRGKMQGE